MWASTRVVQSITLIPCLQDPPYVSSHSDEVGGAAFAQQLSQRSDLRAQSTRQAAATAARRNVGYVT